MDQPLKALGDHTDFQYLPCDPVWTGSFTGIYFTSLPHLTLLHSEHMTVVTDRRRCDVPDIGGAHLKAGKEAVELLCQ